MDERGGAFDDLLDRARVQDPQAWVSLYDRFASLVIAYLRRQSLRDPEDVAGEVFLQVVRDLGTFSGTERQFRSWVLGIAHHRMLDARRRSVRRPVDPVPTERLADRAGSEDATATLVAQADLDDVEGYLAHLTDDQRTVVLLRVVADLTIDEIADVLGRSPGAIKGLQHRAFNALRERLADGRNSAEPADAHPVWQS